MASINLRSLVSKLNPLTRDSLEGAAGLTLSRTHYNIEIEHWLLKLLEAERTDIDLLLKQYEIDKGRLIGDLNRALDKIQTGNSRAPALSPQLVGLVREAWLIASLDYQAPLVRSGHIIAALILDEDMARLANASSGQFKRIPPEVIRKDLVSVTSGSVEAEIAASAVQAAPAIDAGGVPKPAGTAALDKYTTDMTALARAGGIDPVLGRDDEIRQVIDILTRRRQNNPIIVGEPGVGKTAAVEGFALKVAAGEVPDALKNIRLLSLDMGLLQAGAGIKGEFENRLKSVLREVKDSPIPIVMFIDEAHTLIGAGGAEGQGDAANLMKPALARGEMRTVAATTWAEYKKYFEKDAALARRFQVVKIEEPSEEVGIQIMHALLPVLEKHHNVRITSDAIDASVRLSSRYIPARYLPDKSISLLDTACARVGLSQAATPAPVEDVQRQIEKLTTQIGILQRDMRSGVDYADEIKTLTGEKEALDKDYEVIKARWKSESAMVKNVRSLRQQIEATAEVAAQTTDSPEEDGAADSDAVSEDELRTQLAAARAELSVIQGEFPLVYDTVDRDAIAEVVASWTGIPVGRMVSDEVKNILNLKERMGERIKGQPHALDAIAQAVQSSRAKLTDPRKPVGVFLCCGTSGVGKTETALTLADLIYGGEQNVTVINMTEFKEEHKVSLLLGSPPGYVGFGEGGVLTEAVRRKPYSIVLLDEMEKAHPGVQDIFYQVFDKGMLKDGQGRDIDFKNTMIIMTSNAGTETIEKLWADPDTLPDAKGLAEALRPELLKVFKPAFLGRVTLVPFFPLPEDVIKQIVAINLKKVRQRVAQNYGAEFNWTPEVETYIAVRCTEGQSGARNIENILKRSLIPELAGRFLERMINDDPVSEVKVTISEDGEFAYDLGEGPHQEASAAGE